MHSLLKSFVIAVIITQFAILATTVYLHRALSHRALKLGKTSTFIFRLILWISTGIIPREWVAVHRKHHANTDVPGDPHSPIVETFALVQFANVYLYRKAAKNPENLKKYAKDLPADKWDKILFDKSLLGLGIGIAILFVLFGPVVALYVSIIHMAGYLLLSAAVNAIGHTFGDRPYNNLATNNNWLAIITCGEGLHNNHHAAPTASKLSFKNSQIDPGWWTIKFLVGIRQATVRLATPKFKTEHETPEIQVAFQHDL